MNYIKGAMVIVFLICYMTTIGIGICLVAGVFDAKEPAIYGTFAVLIAQTAAVITAIIKAPQFFDVPEDMMNLEARHLNEIGGMQKIVDEVQKRHQATLTYISSKILPDDPQHPLYQWIKENEKLKE